MEISFPDPPLCDGVVALRALRDDDVPMLAVLRRDEAVVRWTLWLQDVHYTTEIAQWEIEAGEEQRKAGRALSLAISDASTDALLGTCQLMVMDWLVGRIGYDLVPEGRGRGAATRSVALLAAWAFDTLEMGRVEAVVHPGNVDSRRVLARLGFQREGLLRAYRPGETGGGDREIHSVLPGELTSPAPETCL